MLPLLLTGTSISGNTATSDGGGIALGGEVDVLGGLVTLNEAPYGAGVYSSDTVGTLQEMVIEANVSSGADSAGGGLYVDSDASLTLTDCTVDDNSTEGWGGGLYTGGANIVFEGGRRHIEPRAGGGRRHGGRLADCRDRRGRLWHRRLGQPAVGPLPLQHRRRVYSVRDEHDGHLHARRVFIGQIPARPVGRPFEA